MKAGSRLRRFAERYGFAMVTTVCVSVITATALWTKQEEHTPFPTPTIPVADMSAAHLIQDSLASVQKPSTTAVPTQTSWHAPLDRMIVMQEFDDQKLSCLNDHGIWQIHDGIDLLVSPGDRIYAIGNGVVTSIDNTDPQSVLLVIEHDNTLTSTYSGLAAVSAMKQGDRVHSGQTIGFAGGSVPNEELQDCHIHLKLERDHRPIDPMIILSELN